MSARAAVGRAVATSWPALLVAAVCAGTAVGHGIRAPIVPLGLLAAAVAGGAIAARRAGRLALAAVALACLGLWWGSLRADALAGSFLAGHLGETAPVRLVVTGPSRRTPFALRVPAEVRRYGAARIRERVLLELPTERAPPQGAVLELWARPVAPPANARARSPSGTRGARTP